MVGAIVYALNFTLRRVPLDSHRQFRRTRCGRDSRDLLLGAPWSAEVALLLRHYDALLGM